MMVKTEEVEKTKAVGGIAPFGYVWRNGELAVENAEAPTRRLIYELFIKHRRKKTVAKLLNDLGYRTRSGALFSDTTIDRLLRDPTAKGIRFIEGKETHVEAVVSEEVWQRANSFLGLKTTKPPVNLFVSFTFCNCGGKMAVPSSLEKYVCLKCRHKINTDDLEAVFVSQLARFPIEIENHSETILSDYWHDLSHTEKRMIVEQICEKITVGATDIIIEFVYLPNSLKTATFGQHIEQGNGSPPVRTNQAGQPTVSEPLMNEIEAAKFLGISRMTLLRRRNAGNISFYRVGFRVLYSKEKHLLPFLQTCEK